MTDLSMYDPKIQMLAEGRCPDCGEADPLLFELMTGKNKGCEHFQKRMQDAIDRENAHINEMMELV